jgi:hypothetical protein
MASTLVEHGWPVVRGTYFDGDNWCGYPDAADLRPVEEDLFAAWTLNASRVTEWWAEQPYSVLVACGYGVDCLEMPAPAGPRALRALHIAGIHPPAMLTPVGTLMLFVRTDPGPGRMLVSASLRTVGSWVAVPPSEHQIGLVRACSYRWLRGGTPDDVGWQLPELAVAYAAITPAERWMAGDSPPGLHPRYTQ